MPHAARWLLAAYLLSALSIASASQSPVPITPTPEWVQAIDVDWQAPIPHESVSGGIHYRLLDRQIDLRSEHEPEFFFRTVETIINQTGIENSAQINITFSPEYETIALHRIDTWRDGERIDKLDSARMSLLSAEDDRNNLIYRGQKLLNVILSDIRIGDSISVSYTRSGYNPVYGGIFGYSHGTNWSVPVDRLHLRLLQGGEKPLHISFINDTEGLSTAEKPWGREYLIDRGPIPAKQTDRNTPQWYNSYGIAYFSELQSWQEVNEWAKPLFDQAIVVDEPVLSIARSIKNKTDSSEEQLSLALQYVQENVRYLSLSIGESSHRPALASSTLRDRHGDCKDKSVLLVAILRALEIEAYPVLVNTVANHKLLKHPPMPQAFDHAIVKARLSDEVYWLDPTRSFQRPPLQNQSQSDYGAALVLRQGTVDLTKVDIEHKQVLTSVRDHLDTSAGIHQPATLIVQTIHAGSSAERMRHKLEQNSPQQIRRDYLDYYTSMFGEVQETDPVAFSENEETGHLHVEESYTIASIWDNVEANRYELSVYPYEIAHRATEIDSENRTSPLALGYPSNAQQTIIIDLPSRSWSFPKTEVAEDNAFFSLRKTSDFDPKTNRLTLSYSYKSKTDHIPPDRISEYKEALKSIEDISSYTLWLNDDPADPTNHSINYGLWIILSYAALLVALTTVWLLEEYRRPFKGSVKYFPVSITKLIVMWAFTFGFYGVYWFYKNWKYIKERDSSDIMPKARAFFFPIWLYPMYSDLRSQHNEGSKCRPAKNRQAVILSFIFFALIAAERISPFPILFMLLAVFPLMPIANYVLCINGNNDEAIQHNSKWRIRHLLLFIASVPVFLFSFGSEIGILPSDQVVNGSRLFNNHLQYMHRQGIIRPGDNIEMFYSDAMLDFRSDGNGYTPRHIFSYWRDRGQLNVESVEYRNIADIDVQWAGPSAITKNTVVTIFREDGSSFVLYLSNQKKRDRDFVDAIEQYWHQHRNEQD